MSLSVTVWLVNVFLVIFGVPQTQDLALFMQFVDNNKKNIDCFGEVSPSSS